MVSMSTLQNASRGEGLLPNFARLQTQGACFDLDAGRDKYSGLAWEHFSSGIRPSDGGRWSAVTFNKRTYRGDPGSDPSSAPFLLTSPPKPSSLTFPISTFLSPPMFAASPHGELTIPVSLQPRGPMAFTKR